jgi:predicted amino acid dehydrogenase
MEKTRGLLEPFVLSTHTVHGASAVDLTVIGIPFTSSQVMAGFRTGDTAWAREQVEQALAMAESRGAAVVGFGGYTSIVTDNCRSVTPESAAITSGNALTAAATVRAVVQASAKLGLRPRRIGIVGALGNIGHVLAELLLDHADRLLLVGRPGAAGRLGARADELGLAAWRRMLRDGVTTGVPGALLAGKLGGSLAATAARLTDPAAGNGASDLVETMFGGALYGAVDAALGVRSATADPASGPVRELLARDARRVIEIATDLDQLTTCNIVVTASNSPRPLLGANQLAAGRVLVCDVAVPGDVDPSVARLRPDVIVIEGGRVRLPHGQRVELPGMESVGGSLYGCLAETILLGFERRATDFATGNLTPDVVRLAGSLAETHGFLVDEGELPQR